MIANSYDARFARHSPGKCLAYRNLVESLGRGIETVDWGGGDSGYKQTIGSADPTELVDYLLVRANILTRPLSRLLEKLWSRSGTPACGGKD